MAVKPARARAFDARFIFARLMFARIGLAASGFNNTAFSAGLSPSSLGPFSKIRQAWVGRTVHAPYCGNTLSSALF
jgi:hypothetical protein